MPDLKNSKVSVLIWDNNEPFPKFDGIILLWNSFYEDANLNIHSLPRLIESKSDLYRKEYLSLAYELGEAKIQNRRIVDWLEIRPGLSFWWMSLLVENNYGKSSEIPNRIKFFALLDFLNPLEIDFLRFFTESLVLAKSVKRYCKTREIKYKVDKKKTNVSIVQKIRRFLPLFFQSFVFLFHFAIVRWIFFPKPKKTSSSKLVFFSYFLNFDRDLVKQSVFSSDYWGKLVAFLNKENILTRWFHFFVDYEALPTISDAKNLIESFNDTEINQFHSLIEEYLSLKVLVKSIFDFLKMNVVSFRIRKIRGFFKYQNGDLQYLYEEDLIDSLRGRAAMLNCLYINLFHQISKDLSEAKTVFYLQENQSWEIALVHAMKAQNLNVFGVPHATIRYWDLRYFYDPRSYYKESNCFLPYPDKVAVNGPGAKSALLESDFPSERILDVEALRYMFLNQLSRKKGNKEIKNSQGYRMLILGDYLPLATFKQMQVFSEAYSKMSSNCTFTVKPHPVCPISKKDYVDIEFNVIDSPLAAVLDQYDFVYTSNITSAAVDAYSVGLPIISFLDGETLNMSPLRGRRNVFFVSNASELVEAFESVKKLSAGDLDTFFNLEEDIPRWCTLIESMIKQEGTL
ncbi:TIGR04326 family surface carbohydrate biosynthesis protein [Leptospira alstonii]|uniref:Surface carbohydrate biosynthesis protein, TIGR04326 family n=2 Tax=Leptospira alstonii TaxID=28452 RepID=M6CY00_9LEPT|nr:TIGR04326 family surface carbohydrate biosynthesis protein [Leptospira alstonii]EMJ96559.1 surface carbohydrate biosynthesis protein, TIGR04326 family [Leptospira alstonii serovar Sichuan str. 79601]EQA80167.1 surface carbohydrate biosynthesis protein, TIGR04326 family [Leptospira alstonii serovar Pingchang str. 80-412]